jgi:hypothetical protein
MAQKQDGKVRVTTFYTVVEKGEEEEDEEEGAADVQDSSIAVTSLHFAVWPSGKDIGPSDGAYLAHDLRAAAKLAARAKHGSDVGGNLVFVADNSQKVRPHTLHDSPLFLKFPSCLTLFSSLSQRC